MTENYRVAFANLQLIVEHDAGEWRIRISDLSGRETLYTAAKPSLSDAKTAAVHFALSRLFGPEHNKDSGNMAASLAWNAVP
jgi:hypothetical protein